MCLPLSPSLAVSCHRLAITRRGPRSPLEEGVVPPISGLNDVWGGWEVKKINHFKITCKQLPKISESTHTHILSSRTNATRSFSSSTSFKTVLTKIPPGGMNIIGPPFFLKIRNDIQNRSKVGYGVVTRLRAISPEWGPMSALLPRVSSFKFDR